MTSCVGAAVAVLGFALSSAPLLAQTPQLRIQAAARTSIVDGTMVQRAPAFPIAALELLGMQVAAQPGGASAVLGADTLRFWELSPAFTAGRDVGHLAVPVTRGATALLLPEQFFIQWLPARYPQLFSYSEGTLTVQGAPLTNAPVAAGARPDNGRGTTGQAQAAATAAGRARTAAQRQRVVILDAGHGGRDAGKIGPNGLEEKQVTLLLANRLAGELRERGYEVHLTRTDDTFIPLLDRPKLANQLKGDRAGALFLSIHANSATNTSVRGFETFFLAEARTADERRVEEMENAVLAFEERENLPSSSALDQLLQSLNNDFYVRASNDLASTIQNRLAGFHSGPDRGVKRAGFLVLVGAVMPAVLVETAFLSNLQEARLLGTAAFQQKLAYGMADAVDEFFSRNEHLWATDRAP